VWIVEELPKGATGKIVKREIVPPTDPVVRWGCCCSRLRALAWARPAGCWVCRSCRRRYG